MMIRLKLRPSLPHSYALLGVTLTTLVLLAAPAAKGQEYPIAFSGQLLNQFDEPVAGATITITGPRRATTRTDRNGQFLFLDRGSQSHPHLSYWQEQGYMPARYHVTQLPRGRYRVYAQKQGHAQDGEFVVEVGAWDGVWEGCGRRCNRNYLAFRVC